MRMCAGSIALAPDDRQWTEEPNDLTRRASAEDHPLEPTCRGFMVKCRRPMREHRASLTSELVAACRAMHVKWHADPVLVDPYAEKLVGRVFQLPIRSRLAYEVMLRAGLRFDWAIAQTATRSRVAEDALDAQRARGPAQWVLLGAGLDMFAWRRPDCAALPQFEVDHPATQRSKQRRIARLGLVSPPHHRFVPVDFARETASQQLLAAGFAPDVPAVFAWLGVTYYLERPAIEATLGDIRSIAAPGSTLVLDYRLPDRHLARKERGPVRRSDRVFARWGEPMLSRFEPAELHALVGRAGWRVSVEHTSRQLADRYFASGRDGLVPTSVYRVVELTPA